MSSEGHAGHPAADKVWAPHEGPQTEFLQSDAFEVLYGGAAGGGKSQAIVHGALEQIGVPKYRGIILRRTFPELQELMDLSLENFGRVSDGAGVGVFNVDGKRWTWPRGAVVEFGYCETYKDVLQYQGDAFQYVGWDELGQIAEERIWLYLLSRVRKTHPAQRLYMRGSANPGGDGHFWINARWISLCPPDGTPVIVKMPRGKATTTRAYFRALLEDNPTLMENDPDYGGRLEALDELEYQWLRLGNWKAGGGVAFPELMDEEPYFVKKFDVPAHWYVWASLDWGYNHPWRAGLYAQDEDENVVKLDTCGGRLMQPKAIAERFWQMVDGAGVPRHRVHRVASGHDIWADVKARSENIPTVADQLKDAEMPVMQANISRIAGVQNMRRYFSRRTPDSPPHFRWMRTKGNVRNFKVVSTRISDPEDIEDVKKVDANARGEGGDDDYDETRYGLAARPIKPEKAKVERITNIFDPRVLAIEAAKFMRGGEDDVPRNSIRDGVFLGG